MGDSAFCIVCPYSALQGAVRGRVYDKSLDESMQFVNVGITLEGRLRIVSDADGHFSAQLDVTE